MKITEGECLVLDRSFPFVRVHTEQGITGIGECFRRRPELTRTLVEEVLGPALVGQDPLDTELRWRDMVRAGSAMELAVRYSAPSLDWTSPCGTSRARRWICPYTGCWVASSGTRCPSTPAPCAAT